MIDVKKKSIIIVGLICCILIIWVSSCIFFSKDNFIDNLENKSNRKEVLLELIKENGIVDAMPNIESYIDAGDIEYFEAVDNTNGTIVTIFLTYPVSGLGDRSYSFTFTEDRKCLLWSKDKIISINGGLCDFNGDNIVDKMLNYFEEDEKRNAKFLPDRLQIYTFKKDKTERLLDVTYNINSSPGDNKYLLLRVKPGTLRESPKIFLKNVSGNNENIEFYWSQKGTVFNSKGKRNDNWCLIYPISDN